MVKVEGHKETIATLVQLSDQMQKRIVLSALRSASKPMLEQARQNAPSDSGKLKKQLGVVSARKGNQPYEKSVLLKHIFSRNRKKKNVNEYYGKFVHEGTKDREVSKKSKAMAFTVGYALTVFARRTKGITANPYLEKAYDSQVATVEQKFGDELEKSLNKFLDKNFKQTK